MERFVIVALFAYLLIRELIFIYTTNKLINKLMSRDYHAYQMSQNVGKLDTPKPKQEEDSLAEDLNTMLGIG